MTPEEKTVQREAVKKELAILHELKRIHVQMANAGEIGSWKIEGCYTKTNTRFPLEGEYWDEERAREAARALLIERNKAQAGEEARASAAWDAVYIVGPNLDSYCYCE